MPTSKNIDDSEEISYGQFIEIEEDLDPAPFDLKPRFDSIQDWLLDMCKNDALPKKIDRYNFSLYESPNLYTIALTGVNSYENKHSSSIKIEFKPTHTYFRLPEIYFQNLDKDQIIEKISSELNGFSRTKIFQTSFFTKAHTVIFETTGQAIWPK